MAWLDYRRSVSLARCARLSCLSLLLGCNNHNVTKCANLQYGGGWSVLSTSISGSLDFWKWSNFDNLFAPRQMSSVAVEMKLKREESCGFDSWHDWQYSMNLFSRFPSSGINENWNIIAANSNVYKHCCVYKCDDNHKIVVDVMMKKFNAFAWYDDQIVVSLTTLVK